MIRAIFLDTGPLGLATKRRGIANADTCRQWIADMNLAGTLIYVPEIADYEVRRELVRAGNTSGVARLDRFNSIPGRYLPITTEAMRRASDLWAQARNLGYATADPKALDGDVILAAQVLSTGLLPSEFCVATDNVGHLSRYVPAELWGNIRP